MLCIVTINRTDRIYQVFFSSYKYNSASSYSVHEIMSITNFNQRNQENVGQEKENKRKKITFSSFFLLPDGKGTSRNYFYHKKISFPFCF